MLSSNACTVVLMSEVPLYRAKSGRVVGLSLCMLSSNACTVFVLGPYGGHRGLAFSYERGTPAQRQRLHSLWFVGALSLFFSLLLSSLELSDAQNL